VIDAENREKLAVVLNDHAGAELCRFDAAHCVGGPDRVGADRSLESLLISEIPAGGLKFAPTLLAE